MSMILLSDDPHQSVNELVLARNVGDTLYKHFPGYGWGVLCGEPNAPKGMVGIFIVDINQKRPYWLKIATINSDKHYRCVMRAGGHLLEAYRLSRAHANDEKIAELPRQLNGDAILDPESLKTKSRMSYVRELGRDAWLRFKNWQSQRPSTS